MLSSLDHMSNSKQIAQDFWFDFDNKFHGPSMSEEVKHEYKILFSQGFDNLLLSWWRTRRDPSYPANFNELLNPTIQTSIKKLTELQYEVISNFLHDYPEMESAFVYFGQGMLYDARRPDGMKIHRMDGDSPDIYIGYYRWHSFLRAASLVEKENQASLQRLLKLDQLVGLAWAIQIEMNPHQDDIEGHLGEDPHNEEMNPKKLNDLKIAWENKGFDELDNEYDNEELHGYLQRLYNVP